VEHLFVCNVLYDRVGHALACCEGAPSNGWEELDAAAVSVAGWVSRLCEQYPADVTVLASDHGFGLDPLGHTPTGCWALWRLNGPVQTSNAAIENCELRERIERELASDDPEVFARLRALGYV